MPERYFDPHACMPHTLTSKESQWQWHSQKACLTWQASLIRRVTYSTKFPHFTWIPWGILWSQWQWKPSSPENTQRRTMITTLRHKNINPFDISQLSGHKILKSTDTYSEAREEQQRKMSLATSGQSEGHVKPLEEKKQLNLQQSSSTESTTSAFAMLLGAFQQLSSLFCLGSPARPNHSPNLSSPGA